MPTDKEEGSGFIKSAMDSVEAELFRDVEMESDDDDARDDSE